MSAPRSARRKPERPQGLPPQRRVLRTGEFARIERQGSRTAGALLVLVTRTRRDGRPGRVGFTISRKVGNAVVRNRLRRRLKEVVRHHKEWLDARDLVVIVKPEASSATSAVLLEQLTVLIQRASAPRPARSPHEPPPKS